MKLLHGGSFEVISFAVGKIHGGNSGGIINSFGRVVDLGVLSQTPKS
jgi:hypothetical protein